jgi:hypothetical protein
MTDSPPQQPRTEAGRATCQCGASVLAENADNHLLRRDGGPHEIVSWPLPRTAAGMALYGSLEVMGPTHREVAASILAIEEQARVVEPPLPVDPERFGPIYGDLDAIIHSAERAINRLHAAASVPLPVDRLREAITDFLKRWDNPERYHRLPAVDDLRAALAAPTPAPPALDVERFENDLWAALIPFLRVKDRGAAHRAFVPILARLSGTDDNDRSRK